MNHSQVSVAVVSAEKTHRGLLVEILHKRGFETVVVESLAEKDSANEQLTPIPQHDGTAQFLDENRAVVISYFLVVDIEEALTTADVVIVDISSGIDNGLEQVIAKTVEVNKPALYLDDYLPVNTPSVMADIEQRLTEKLLSLYAHQQDYLHVPHKTWLLAGSTGGPEAVKEFIENLPADSDYSFLYVQHIEPGFEKNLIAMFSNRNGYQAQVARSGDVLTPKSILVVPANRQLRVLTGGIAIIEDAPWQGRFQPSIDATAVSFANGCGYDGGIIIFSGMDCDGTSGAKIYASKGGRVWAQEPDTCVVNSMPESVMKCGVVAYSASPKEMAEQLVRGTDKSPT